MTKTIPMSVIIWRLGRFVGWGFVDIQGEGVQEIESPDFRSPEVAISANLCCHNSAASGAHSKQTHI